MTASACSNSGTAHSPVRTPGGHSGWQPTGTCFQPSLLFTLSPALLLPPSTSYCEVHSYPGPFRWDKRRGHTDACHFSQLRTVGQSDRTPSTPIHFATTNHDSRFANTVLSVLYHRHRVPFYPKRRNQFLLTDSSSTHVPRICKKMAPWNSEPPMTPLGSSNPGSTHCQIQSSRWKGLSTEFFTSRTQD